MNRKAIGAWAWVVLLWTLAGCGVAIRPNGDGGGPPPDVPTIDAPGGCRLPDGRVLAVGESFFDGCNTCACGMNGFLSCTLLVCDDVVTPPPPPPPPPPPVCRAPDGTPLPAGATWLSPDGCTSCFCAGGGSLECGTRPNCMDGGLPPPPVCFAPDGTPVPVGSTIITRDRCFSCSCVTPGGAARCAPTGGCTDGGTPTVCSAPDGTPLPIGGTWTSPDRCTSCTCDRSGSLSCATRPGCFDSGVVVCRAPDGSSILAGTSWSSRDGCTQCFCSPSGSLSCATNPRCADGGVVVCRAPDGSSIPPGMSWLSRDGCTQCICSVSGSLSCAANPRCVDGGGVSDAGPVACNSVPPSMLFAPVRSAFGTPPSGSGGTLVDGYYQLRELIFYGGGSTPPIMGVRYAVQISRGEMQFNVETGPGGTPQRVNFSYVTGGSLIRLTQICGGGGGMMASSGFFSVRRDGFDLYIDAGGGQIQHLNFVR